MKITLVKTCDAYPEQYDAYDEDQKLIGNLRLRHGAFSVDYFPREKHSVRVYSAHPYGDGEFDDENERDYYLRFAVDALIKAHTGQIDFTEVKLAPNVKYEIKHV